MENDNRKDICFSQLVSNDNVFKLGIYWWLIEEAYWFETCFNPKMIGTLTRNMQKIISVTVADAF